MVWVAKIEVDDSVEIAEGWIGTSFGVELNTAAKPFPTGPGLLPRTPASKANFDFFASLTAVAWSNNIFLFFPEMLSTSTAIAILEATGGGGEVACSADPWVGVGELYFTLPGIIHMESMEWGVDSRNSRWNPWTGGWTP